jgi:hypothetical protein
MGWLDSLAGEVEIRMIHVQILRECWSEFVTIDGEVDWRGNRL